MAFFTGKIEDQKLKIQSFTFYLLPFTFYLLPFTFYLLPFTLKIKKGHLTAAFNSK